MAEAATTTTPAELEAGLDLLLRMFAEDYDWGAHRERDDPNGDPKDVFRACFLVPEKGEKLAGCGVGSRGVENTPDGLYRVLFLLRPKALDFSDMYKSGLLTVASPDRRYIVNVEFWKYELALRFYAPKETVPPKLVSGPFDITSGIPGVDNGWHTTDPLAIKFFDVFTEAIGREWDVYGGNNFSA